jgi:flagellum-specific ATP synthase
VVATGQTATIPTSKALLGRVIDGMGRALDGRPDPTSNEHRALKSTPRNPMDRPRISHILETGVRSIDTLLTLGQGQRVGIFSGSGVGKSTLLGMVARHVRADVNVIALIGERSREVREFIDKQLGDEGLARSVVIVATADQPALARIRAAYAAVTIAESFRDQGLQTLLTIDSITRLAMARREVGLSAGEPPTARGYTPSVFSELPELCERCGTGASGGSITALLTVLVEGDDLNEPIADCMRATLDGHIVLSRRLANQGQYPAIDILASTSRLMSDLASSQARALAIKANRCLETLQRNRQLVDIGAYVAGSNPALDQALAIEDQLLAFLRQSDNGIARDTAINELSRILQQVSA